MLHNFWQYFGWSPNIEDPSLGGWMVILFYITTTLTYYQLYSKRITEDIQERKYWKSITLILSILCLNKLINIQDMISQIGRVLVYQNRELLILKTAQFEFVIASIVLFFILIVVAAILLTFISKGYLKKNILSVFGLILLLGFLSIRIISQHDMDVFMEVYLEKIDVRIKAIIEIMCISLIYLSAQLRKHDHSE